MISKGSCPHAIDVLFCRNRDGPGDAVRTSDDAPREHAEGAQVVRRCLSSTKPKKHERTKTANLGLRNLKIRVARRSARVAALKFKMPATKPAKLKRRQMEPVESSTERYALARTAWHRVEWGVVIELQLSGLVAVRGLHSSLRARPAGAAAAKVTSDETRAAAVALCARPAEVEREQGREESHTEREVPQERPERDQAEAARGGGAGEGSSDQLQCARAAPSSGCDDGVRTC